MPFNASLLVDLLSNHVPYMGFASNLDQWLGFVRRLSEKICSRSTLTIDAYFSGRRSRPYSFILYESYSYEISNTDSWVDIKLLSHCVVKN